MHLFNVSKARAYLNCSRINEFRRIHGDYKPWMANRRLRCLCSANSNRAYNPRQPAPDRAPRAGAAFIPSSLVARRVQTGAERAPAAVARVWHALAELVEPRLHRFGIRSPV